MRLTSRTIVGSGTCSFPACLIRPLKVLGLLLLFLGGLGVAQAAPPSNDHCQNAEVIPGNLGFPILSSVIQDISEADPLSTDLVDIVEPECIGGVSRSVWFQFTPPQTGLYRVSVGRFTATTVIDTVLAMYTSADGCNGPFTSVACNDDAGTEDPDVLRSAFMAQLQAGVTYYIVVWQLGDYPPDVGATAIQVRISVPAPAPVNDICTNAISIPGAGPFPYSTETVETLLATESPEDPIPSCRETDYTMRTVWYEFTPTRTALYSLATCVGTETRVLDTVISVYTSTNGCAGNLEEVACNDDWCDFKSTVRMTMQAGTTYYIMVSDGEEEPAVDDSEVQLRITNPAEAITLPASGITSLGATLNGIVRPNGLTTTFYFEYGVGTSFDQRGPVRILFGSVSEAMTNHVVTNITANTLYRFRLVASNSNGESIGEELPYMYSTNQPVLEGLSIPVSGGSFQFQFSGSAGQIYGVDRSTNLVHWESLGMPMDLGNGLFNFLDTDPPTVPARFYRVVVP